jgi:hypothetical protein
MSYGHARDHTCLRAKYCPGHGRKPIGLYLSTMNSYDHPSCEGMPPALIRPFAPPERTTQRVLMAR